MTAAINEPSAATPWVMTEPRGLRLVNSVALKIQLCASKAQTHAQSVSPAVPQVAVQAVAATWASFWTVGITSPLDVLKTRIQLSKAETTPALVPLATSLLRAEGLSGLYRGFVPRWCQASIFTACVINIYEHLKKICRK